MSTTARPTRRFEPRVPPPASQDRCPRTRFPILSSALGVPICVHFLFVYAENDLFCYSFLVYMAFLPFSASDPSHLSAATSVPRRYRDRDRLVGASSSGKAPAPTIASDRS